MTGDHFGHRTDRFFELEGALVGVAVDLHADEDREAEANTIASQRSSIAFDVSFAFEPLDPPEARRRRQPHPVGKLYVAKPRVGLQFGDNPAVDGVQNLILAWLPLLRLARGETLRLTWAG